MTDPTSAAPAEPRAPDADFQLVQRTVAGDQRAFELLVIKYQRRIERLIGRMVRDTDLIPDIAQETFSRLPGVAPVSRRSAVLYLALPHCSQYRQEDLAGPQAQSGGSPRGHRAAMKTMKLPGPGTN